MLLNKTDISIYFKGMGWKTWWKLGETSETYGFCFFFEGVLKCLVKHTVLLSKTICLKKSGVFV